MRPIVLLLGVSGLTRIILVYLRKIILYFTRHSDQLRKLDHYHFGGVISTSPLDIRENKVVNFLKTRGIGSMAMIISWDNLTSKGVINADHDYILVWNQFMADEYERFYSIFRPQKSKVCITGIPRFDIYFRNQCQRSTSDFRLKFKIEPLDKVILFATSASKHFPNQILIVNDLIEYTRRRANVKVIVRCHPADRFEHYRPFHFEKSIIVWQPENLRCSTPDIFSRWIPRIDFLETLSSMIKISDVCVQVASTIRLDAAACDKPVISIAYDGPRLLPYSQSVKRLYDYSHQVPLNRLKMDQMVYNKSQLFASLDKTLNGNCHTDYKSLARPFIHYSEPKSVDSVIQNVQAWLG
ncbi:CDP-glycerol glycerophosphotransferase family protein [Dyadobacter pollutisoli]|uniref:CDP-glycerol glycerophosphotransferase family protein n=1 Tax=Dyadobacter pollutisoli TaxID=2910158 RepID=A0A9E8SK91_9BACT|nr:CDP-glycerol glycerophosphotransferase family protein [Dyadobacter pollutisoli]WAC10516.1 CDP-glycerol glycerophosphotransferase family protein [Dyadobacter pollutisoli]